MQNLVAVCHRPTMWAYRRYKKGLWPCTHWVRGRASPSKTHLSSTCVIMPKLVVLYRSNDTSAGKICPLASRLSGSLQVIGNDTVATIGYYDFLLVFRSKHGPFSCGFRDKRRFRSKITFFSNPRLFNAPLRWFPRKF